MYEKITTLFLVCSAALSAGMDHLSSCDECITLSSAYPKAHLTLGVDFLAWKICQSDLDYAFESPLPDVSRVISSYYGERENIDLDWEAGFRVHAGYQFGCDGFVLSASYTFFHPTSNGKIRAKECNILLLDKGCEVLEERGFVYQEIGWHTKHDYNVLDLLFSRPTCVSQTYVLTPYFGARGFWLNQEFTFDGTCIETPLIINHVKYTSDFSGGGLHAGMRHELLFCGCLGIYGDVGASIIAGKTEDALEQIVERLCEKQSVPYIGIEDDHCCCMPGLDLALGVNWSSHCKCYFVKVNLGYEMSYWWNVPTLRRYSNTISIPQESVAVSDRGTSATSSTLLAHGVTLNASIYF